MTLQLLWTDGERLGREEMFSALAQVVALRGTCRRAQVGVVIVQNRRVISMGYNGSPSGMPHCDEHGCEISDGGCIRSIHAEANAILWAARYGIPIEGAELFSTHSPCLNCAKLIVGSGITKVWFRMAYRDVSGIDLLDRCGVKVLHQKHG